MLFSVEGAVATSVSTVSMSELGLQERLHLQQWILAHPQVLGPDVAVISSEYADWTNARGERVADRLDILGVDTDGRLVVAELKRDAAPHTVHMQAINYAAMVSRLTIDDVAELHVERRRKLHDPIDHEAAVSWLQTKRLVTSETLQRPRIVLVATHFPVSVTASVVWLNEQGVDIWLIRFRPYRLPSGQVVVAFSRLFPVPDVEEFSVRRSTGVSSEIADDGPGPPWDRPALASLAEAGNAATLSVLDLCAAPNATGVRVTDVIQHAGVTVHQVRGHLAGLTMLLKNKRNGFAQNAWPFRVEWLPGGVAEYHMDPGVAATWRELRGVGLVPGTHLHENSPLSDEGSCAEGVSAEGTEQQ